MAMFEDIQRQFIDARKKQDKFAVGVLTMLVSDLKYEMINKKKEELDDGDVLVFLQKTLKQKKDVLVEFEKAGRADLSEKEKKEIEFLTKLMPAMMSEAEVRQVVDEVKKELNAASPADMGKVMKEVMVRVKGKADGGMVKNLVADALKNA
jgi:uncharacterized protein